MSDPVSFARAEPTEDLDRIRIGRILGFDKLSQIDRYKNQIDRLKQWAVAKGAKDDNSITDSIRDLMNRTGSPTPGANWATHLSVVAHLELEQLQIDKQIDQATPNKVELKDGNKSNPDSPAGEAEVSGTQQ